MIFTTILLKRILVLNYWLLIQIENVYKELFKQKDLFDFSNYSKDSEFFDVINMKVIGKMKDEFGGVITTEFV